MSDPAAKKSLAECPSSVLVGCGLRTADPQLCFLASLRKNKDQVARSLASLHHRATHVPRDPDTLEDRTKGVLRAVVVAVCATHAPQRLVSGAARQISFSPFKARRAFPSRVATPNRRARSAVR